MMLTTKNGFIFQVDDQDVLLASEKGWCGYNSFCYRTDGKRGKIQKRIMRNIIHNGKRTTEQLHRCILNATAGTEIDHINGDTLDCRRNNLRVCTRAQNGANRGNPLNNASGYKGVTWHKVGKRWQSQIKVNGKRKYIGLFKTKEEAALAYNREALRQFGEFAKLNELTKHRSMRNGG